ncbi:MAG: hypothetical protein K8M05_21220 [Deltaproteobacteria bacterium]|nr:hypothetical protein [Kofleriaceae bacterium]
MTDEDHIRYMLDGGERGLIERLWETKDAWGFGGSLWIAKEHPLFKDGPMRDASGDITRLTSYNRFEKTRFHLADTGARGWAVWFLRGPRDAASGSMDNRSLCGWVHLEREAELSGWLDFLNSLIETHVEKASAAWSAMTEAERQAVSDRHVQRSLAFFRSLGISMPDAENMDELVDKMQEMGKDGPIDLRSGSTRKRES